MSNEYIFSYKIICFIHYFKLKNLKFSKKVIVLIPQKMPKVQRTYYTLSIELRALGLKDILP
jgi:hypothetical protein